VFVRPSEEKMPEALLRDAAVLGAIHQLYVMPGLVRTEACQFEVPAVTTVAPDTVGVMGYGTTFIEAEPGKEDPVPEVVRTQLIVTAPAEDWTLNVIELVLLPAVMVEPLEIVQA
jgi:hypothetical protein